MSALPRVRPMQLVQRAEPFDDPSSIFEVKFDGFRALAYVEQGKCRLVSRKDNTYQSFTDLCAWIGQHLKAKDAILDGEVVCAWIGQHLKAKDAILDGEVVCLDEAGRSVFNDLFYRKGEVYFYAFDLLWLNGKDLRDQPLLKRKARLKKLLPEPPSYLLYMDHVKSSGCELYRTVCEMDLEGIVAKKKDGPYSDTRSNRWIKIKNPSYSQSEGRQEQFRR